MSEILGILFVGIVLLFHACGLVPDPSGNPTLLSQLAERRYAPQRGRAAGHPQLRPAQRSLPSLGRCTIGNSPRDPLVGDGLHRQRPLLLGGVPEGV